MSIQPNQFLTVIRGALYQSMEKNVRYESCGDKDAFIDDMIEHMSVLELLKILEMIK